MSSLVVSLLLAVLLAQFLVWLFVTVDVRDAADPTLRWVGVVVLFPLVGLVAAAWYLANRRALRAGSDPEN